MSCQEMEGLKLMRNQKKHSRKMQKKKYIYRDQVFLGYILVLFAQFQCRLHVILQQARHKLHHLTTVAPGRCMFEALLREHGILTSTGHVIPGLWEGVHHQGQRQEKGDDGPSQVRLPTAP